MSKKAVIISTSPRHDSNSHALAEAFARGAQEAGNEVELISLRGKKIAFCLGCFACQEKGSCVIRDDAVGIEEKVLEADVVVWATPIYYYEMSGQMKTLIDRLNPLFPKDYRFRDVYLLATAADDSESTPDRAVEGVKGWVECFEKAAFKGSVFCGGVNDPGDIRKNEKLDEAYRLGQMI
ncbi:MAG: flavodoxin family protein [Clostridia bacterium]|nr:flavodoxin family protein [Clostridia bacterium]MBQ6425859.1 flavodoxin family protein [Clostridia bacterium]MBR0444037.1 flavodoxin family protein [Clostridia bacterium]